MQGKLLFLSIEHIFLQRAEKRDLLAFVLTLFEFHEDKRINTLKDLVSMAMLSVY